MSSAGPDVFRIRNPHDLTKIHPIIEAFLPDQKTLTATQITKKLLYSKRNDAQKKSLFNFETVDNRTRLIEILLQDLHLENIIQPNELMNRLKNGKLKVNKIVLCDCVVLNLWRKNP